MWSEGHYCASASGRRFVASLPARRTGKPLKRHETCIVRCPRLLGLIHLGSARGLYHSTPGRHGPHVFTSGVQPSVVRNPGTHTRRGATLSEFHRVFRRLDFRRVPDHHGPRCRYGKNRPEAKLSGAGGSAKVERRRPGVFRDLNRRKTVLLARFTRCAGCVFQGSNPPTRSATHVDSEQRSHLLALLAVSFVAEAPEAGFEPASRP